jgi:hypothetical protein
MAQTAVRLILIIVAALVLFALITYYNRHKAPERFSTRSEPSPVDLKPLNLLDRARAAVKEAPMPASVEGAATTAASVSPTEPMSNEKYRPVAANDGAKDLKDAFPQDRISPEELLPRNAANSKWAQVNPAGQGSVADQNFLTAGHHLGVDTQGSSLRNASHDLRAEPVNPRYKVSIWNSSSIEPDMHRKPLV